jgi:S-adenosylmethionine synthetase
MVSTFGTGAVPDAVIERAIREVFDLTPRAITEQLDLRKPIYSATAAYGHFGRTPEAFSFQRKDGGSPGTHEATRFTWERTDKADALGRGVR